MSVEIKTSMCFTCHERPAVLRWALWCSAECREIYYQRIYDEMNPQLDLLTQEEPCDTP